MPDSELTSNGIVWNYGFEWMRRSIQCIVFGICSRLIGILLLFLMSIYCPLRLVQSWRKRTLNQMVRRILCLIWIHKIIIHRRERTEEQQPLIFKTAEIELPGQAGLRPSKDKDSLFLFGINTNKAMSVN